jgi:hypothetical protein
MPRCTTTFRGSATSRTVTATSSPAPPLSQSGAISSQPDPVKGWGKQRLVRIVLTAPCQHIEISDHGKFVVLRPLSEESIAWFDANVGPLEPGFIYT